MARVEGVRKALQGFRAPVKALANSNWKENDVAKKPRQYLTDEKKTRIVAKFIIGRKNDPALTVAWHAKHSGVLSTVLRRWLKDPRYGGKPGLGTRGSRTVLSELPTESMLKQSRAKPLVAVKFVCPHCGGAILGGNHAKSR